MAVDYDLPILFLRESDPQIAREYPAIAAVGAEIIRELDAHQLPMLDEVFQFYDNAPHERRKATYLEMLQNLKPGVSEVIIHCGYDNAELRAITDSAAMRDSDRRIFMDRTVQNEIERLDIHVISWKQFREMNASRSR